MIKKILLGLAAMGAIGVIGFNFNTTNTLALNCPSRMIEINGVCVVRDDTNTDIATDTIPAIVGVLMWGIGIVSVAMIVFGGIMMTSSAGNPERAKKGRMAAIGGVGGLVIAILSYAIVSFVYTNI